MSTSLDAVAGQFLSLLHEQRGQCQQRPIIFIAHCFGGIVLEKAILKALLNNSAEDGSLVERIAGIIFLGTPHRGTPKAGVANLVAAVAAAMSDSVKNSPILEPLKEDSQILQDTVGEFARWANRVNLRIHCFYELLKTDIVRMAGPILRIKGLTSSTILVPRDSGCLQGHDETALNLNHIKLNRFTDATDANYILVSRALQEMGKVANPPRLEVGPDLRTKCLESLHFEQVQNRELDIKPALKDTTAWLWELDELQDFFKSAYSDMEKPKVRRTMLFIDALDESGGEGDMDAYNVARELVHFFYYMTAESQLKVCLSSRHYPQIRVPHCPQITTEELNSGDIACFVKARSFRADHDERAMQLAKVISEKAKGVFLWVILVIQKLNMGLDNEITDEDLDEMLRKVPSQLEKLFVDLFSRDSCSQSELQMAARIFQWVLLAEKPLKGDVLRHALTIDKTYMTPLEHGYNPTRWYLRRNCIPGNPDKFLTSLRGYTRGLIEISSRYTDVQFIHESARELFLSGPGFSLLENLHNDSPAQCQDNKSLAKRHDALAEYCIACICQMAVFERAEFARDGPLICLTHPFLDYARNSFFYHIRQVERLTAGSGDSDAVTNSLVTALLEPDQVFWETWKVLWSLENETPCPYLCRRGFLASAQALLDRGVDVNTRSVGQFTALHYATMKSDDKLVRFLLKNKADPTTRDKNGRTPLHMVACDDYFPTDFSSSLDPILADPRFVEAEDNDDLTPLQLALVNLRWGFVELLISRGVRFNSPMPEGMTLLQLMQNPKGAGNSQPVVNRDGSSDEKLEVIHLMGAVMAAGEDRNAADDLGKTPLHHALETATHIWAVPVLVLGYTRRDGILDVTKPDKSGQTPLHYAVQGPCELDGEDDDTVSHDRKQLIRLLI